MTTYKVQILKNLTDLYKIMCFEFYVEMQHRYENSGVADQLIFTNEATFKVSGNMQNISFGATENPRYPVQDLRYSQ